MRNLLTLLILLSCSFSYGQTIVTSDIDNFWIAYDKIISTEDSTQQMKYLQTLYLDKATPGLESLREVRYYTAELYLWAIKNHPRFWESIRANTLKAKTIGGDLQAGIEKLRKLYPDLKPANIYFSMGAFRTNGTALSDRVLIGAEMAMADQHTVTTDFNERMQPLRTFFDSNPIDNIVFLNVHEFVHTQQVEAMGSNLLAICLREGTAEFIAELTMDQTEVNACISYGKKHEEALRKQFEKELFNKNTGFWLWTNQENQFGERDLGYAVGYTISKKYYDQATDKRQAIKELIEVDYHDAEAVETIVDRSGYFGKTLAQLRKKYESNRPQVVKIEPFTNNSKTVKPGKHLVTVHFSEPMNVNYRGFEFGPLGEEHVLRIQQFIGFSEDGKSVSFEVDLVANKRFQVTLSDRFQSMDGTELAPYIVDVTTKE